MNNARYRELVKTGFNAIGSLDRRELSSLLEIHRTEIEFHREERKMHFGAMALVAVLIFLTLPLANSTGPLHGIALALMGLLLILEIPYIIVYYRYENRLLRMNREYIRIRDMLNSCQERDQEHGADPHAQHQQVAGQDRLF